MVDLFDADFRRFDADERGFRLCVGVEIAPMKICGNLRFICGNLRLKRGPQTSQS
jgi:hypothetical protein